MTRFGLEDRIHKYCLPTVGGSTGSVFKLLTGSENREELVGRVLFSQSFYTPKMKGL